MLTLEKSKELKKFGWPQKIVDNENSFGWFRFKETDKEYTYTTYKEADTWKYYTDAVTAPSIEELLEELKKKALKDLDLRSLVISSLIKYFAGEFDNFADLLAGIWIGEVKVWMPVLEDDDSENYMSVWFKYSHLKRSKNDPPYFFDRKDCDQWCYNHTYKRGTIILKN